MVRSYSRSLARYCRRIADSSQAVDVVVSIPDDAGIAAVFSVDASGTHDAAFVVDAAARTVTLPAVALDNDTPTRLFVLATTDDVRAQVDADAAR